MSECSTFYPLHPHGTLQDGFYLPLSDEEPEAWLLRPKVRQRVSHELSVRPTSVRHLAFSPTQQEGNIYRSISAAIRRGFLRSSSKMLSHEETAQDQGSVSTTA